MSVAKRLMISSFMAVLCFAAPAFASGHMLVISVVPSHPDGQAPAPLTVDHSKQYTGTATRHVDIRLTPTSTGKVVGSVVPGDIVNITGTVENSPWYEVQVGGKSAFVSAEAFDGGSLAPARKTGLSLDSLLPKGMDINQYLQKMPIFQGQ